MDGSGMAQLRVMVVGAHPDDCELKAGGTAALYCQGGHQVTFVSVTDGRCGHQSRFGDALAAERAAEANRAAAVLGLQSRILGFPDASLQPSLDARNAIIRLIREGQPDLVITHRPNDYHPDHRSTSQLVCDAAYLLTVPGVVPEVTALRADPVIAYMMDDFARPYPFTPDVVVDIGGVTERVVEMLACHRSQFFDWLPYNRREEQLVPEGEDERRRWLGDWYRRAIRPFADRHRERIVRQYGTVRGAGMEFIEAFEACEYGAPLTDARRRALFPFVPWNV